jgi:hypothetical protein
MYGSRNITDGTKASISTLDIGEKSRVEISWHTVEPKERKRTQKSNSKKRQGGSDVEYRNCNL